MSTLANIISAALDACTSRSLDDADDRAAVLAVLVAALHPTTVSAALDTRVIECRDDSGLWWQLELHGVEHRTWEDDAADWSDWSRCPAPAYVEELPFRYVAREDANDSPVARGPVGGGS